MAAGPNICLTQQKRVPDRGNPMNKRVAFVDS